MLKDAANRELDAREPKYSMHGSIACRTPHSCAAQPAKAGHREALAQDRPERPPGIAQSLLEDWPIFEAAICRRS